MTTLAVLTADILSYTSYSSAEFTAQIARFIQEAEERTWFAVQLPNFRKAVTGSVAASSPYLSLPPDFLAPASLAVIDPITGEYTYLLNKDVSYIRQVWPAPTYTARPFAYALFDADADTTNIIMGPTPDLSYACELNYFYKPVSLTVNTTGTWLSENAYDTLLYGSLSEAANWMKKTAGIDTMGDTYEARFGTALQTLKTLGQSRDRKDTYRGGELRSPEGM
jgi:hypothetical protein